MVLEVLRHLLAGVEALLDLRVGDVAGDDERAGERQPGLDRVLGQLGEDLVHRPVEVDLDDDVAAGRADADGVVGVLAQVDGSGVGQEAGRVGLQLLDEDALGRDLAEGLAVGRARDRDGDGQTRAVAGEADDAHVVAEVLAAELGADAEAAGQLEHLLLELGVAEAVGGDRARLGQGVEVLRRRVLRCLQGELGARAADDDGQVVGRAGRGAERAQLLVEEAQHGVLGFRIALVSW